jgi:hypothetical protein
MILPHARTDVAIVVASAAIALGGIRMLQHDNLLGWWLLAASVAAVAAVYILRLVLRRFEAVPQEESLEVSAWGVRRFVPGGRLEALSWDDLSQVSVSTAPDAEDGEDVHLRLSGGEDRAVQVAHTMAVESGLLAELATRLRGFDQSAMVEALTHGHNSVAVLWRAPRPSESWKNAGRRRAPSTLRAAS